MTNDKKRVYLKFKLKPNVKESSVGTYCRRRNFKPVLINEGAMSFFINKRGYYGTRYRKRRDYVHAQCTAFV